MAFAAGQKLRASELRPPVISLRRNTAQAITSAVWNDVSWNSELIDTDGAWTAAAPTQVIIPKTGYYLVSASIGFEPSTVGASRGVELNVDGALVDGGEVLVVPSASGSRRAIAAVTLILSLTLGDVVTVKAFQDSGAALNIGVTSQYFPSLNIAYLRD